LAEDCLQLIVAAENERDKMEMQSLVYDSPAFRVFLQNHSHEDGEVEFLNSIAWEGAVDVAKVEAEMEGAADGHGHPSNHSESTHSATNPCSRHHARLPKMSYMKGRERKCQK
jgi:hypothetical protein